MSVVSSKKCSATKDQKQAGASIQKAENKIQGTSQVLIVVMYRNSIFSSLDAASQDLLELCSGLVGVQDWGSIRCSKVGVSFVDWLYPSRTPQYASCMHRYKFQCVWMTLVQNYGWTGAHTAVFSIVK